MSRAPRLKTGYICLSRVRGLIGEEYTGFYGQSAGGLQGGVNFRNATVRELPEKTQVYISFSTSFLPGHNNAEFNFNGQTHSNKSEQAYPYVAGNLAIHFAGLESNNNSSILVPRQCVVKSVDATYLYPQIVIKLQLTGPRSCDKISLEKTIYHGDLDNLLSEFARYGVYFILPPPDIIE
ncbi:MAG: hypothetical protein KUL82_02740 [Bdellovibrio sp.]|nr:hypothetical protein [Bdellovibrio sp.]